MPESIVYEKHEHLAILTMNRPQSMNAINLQMRLEMNESLVDFKNDPNAWVLILTGTGEKAFSAGVDIKELRTVTSGKLPEAPSITLGVMELFKPVIAAINGIAIGGGLELAMACDVRLAADDVRLGLMEAKRGLMPRGGGCVTLPRLVPLGIAMEMLLSGDLIDAREAYRVGLVNEIVPRQALMPAANRMAERLLECSPIALRAIKETVVKSLDLTLKDALRARFGIDPLTSEDAKEGIAAFAEKRKPVWRGK
jgi:enoyl-CoA hydratase/carnithine racemase